jgi:uncharacterized protein YutE (UPF0331/DUF86 family)
MKTDIVTNKTQSIHRCVKRAREEYLAEPETFESNFTRQDAAVLNVLRACEQAIDLANHIIQKNKFGIPNSSAESFELLWREKIMPSELKEKLVEMVKFRNTVTHQYQRMKAEIVIEVIQTGLDDLIQFADYVLDFEGY